MSSSAKATIVVVIAFIAGLFVGIAGDRFVLIRRGQLFPRRGAEFSSRRLVDHLNRELRLSDAQRTQVQRIVDQHHAAVENVWSSVRPKVRAEIDAANREIDTVLTADQRTKFHAMRARVERRRGAAGAPF
jgi:hypothetical protein